MKAISAYRGHSWTIKRRNTKKQSDYKIRNNKCCNRVKVGNERFKNAGGEVRRAVLFAGNGRKKKLIHL